MPTNQQDKQPRSAEPSGTQQRDAVLSRRVLHALGEPESPHWVQVRELWEGHYRINVLVSADIASTRIAHSYFVVTDEAGTIVATTPPITRQY